MLFEEKYNLCRLCYYETQQLKNVQIEVTEVKEGIHPKYVPAEIRCACGEVVATASTKGDQRVDICSKCHPFFTGKQKLVDTGGRVDRFKKRYNLNEGK